MAKTTTSKTRKRRIPRKRKPHTTGLASLDCRTELTDDLRPVGDRVKQEGGAVKQLLHRAWRQARGCETHPGDGRAQLEEGAASSGRQGPASLAADTKKPAPTRHPVGSPIGAIALGRV
jgi:hypothetical protein